MNSMAETKDQRIELCQPNMSEEESIPAPQEHQHSSSGRAIQSAMRRSRSVWEVAIWSAYFAPIVIQGGVQTMSVILQKSFVLFGRDGLGYWYFLCHHHTGNDNETTTTYVQWRKHHKLETISWTSLLVEGPMKLGQRVYPTVKELGQEILLPGGIRCFRLMAEISMRVFKTILGILISLSPWAVKLIWPERHYRSTTRGKGTKVVVVAGEQCELGNSIRCHVDIISDTSHDGDATAVSEITNDEAIRSPAGSVHDSTREKKSLPDRILGIPTGVVVTQKAKRTQEGIKRMLRSTPLSTNANTEADNKASLLQRLPMEALRSKWKKTTGLKSTGIQSSTKLKRSLLKQKVV